MFVLSFVGCGESVQPSAQRAALPPSESAESADHLHDVPPTEEEINQLKAKTAEYGRAIQQVKSYRDQIAQATTIGKPSEAHYALDRLELVLEWLPGIARDSDLPRARWEEINTTAQSLRGLFDKVHEKIDAGEEPGYAGVADEIDRLIQRLTSLQSEAANASEQPAGELQ